MNASLLHAKLRDFEEVVDLCATLEGGGDRIARALCELYITRRASALVSYVGTLYPDEVEAARVLVQIEHPASLRWVPSKPDTTVSETLVKMVEFRNAVGATKALESMGALVLCPPLEKQLDRLEFVVGCVIGRARLIPLVEVALFAVEQGAYERASRYAGEARTLGPGPSELHDLLTVAGAIALNSGSIASAKNHLFESARVCEEDRFRRIRPFSVLLAERLLTLGEQDAVIAYLKQCEQVWIHQRNQIAIWIDVIQGGRQPDFLASGFLGAMNNPKVKVRELILRASLLDDTLDLGPVSSAEDFGVRRQDRIAEYRRQNSEAIKGKLETGKN
jgi:hypothetical protein